MPAYYSTPLYSTAPSPAYIPPPRFTVPTLNHPASSSHAPTTRTSTYYHNHRWTGGPQNPNHRRTADPGPWQNYNHRWTVAGPLNQNHQVAARGQVHAPAVLYSTPRPPKEAEAKAEAKAEVDADTDVRARTVSLAYPARRRLLLLDPSRTPTQTRNHAYDNHIVYSTKTCGPIYSTKYIPPLGWPALGPHIPQPLPPPGWEPRRTRRMAFRLAERARGQGKKEVEGVPLALLLSAGWRTLGALVEGADESVLPHIYPRPAGGVTLRFWSPVYPYAMQEYTVPIDREEHYTKRLRLALHVARAYHSAAYAVPESTQRSSKDKDKDQRPFRVKAIGPRRVSLDDVWLVALRGTEREDVFDVCVHYHPDCRYELKYD